MAGIILKSPYLKPHNDSHASRYVKYIATRDGVEKLSGADNSLKPTSTQKKVVTALLKDYPDIQEMDEYEDYIKNPSRKNANELMMRVAEVHSELFESRQRYVDYIATRPSVEKISSHGLFGNSDEPIDLKAVANEIANHEGNIWTHIISLPREDADRLGYNTVESWKTLLRDQQFVIAENMKIKTSDLRWYAAFHNADTHPHVHMMVYSADPKRAYLSEMGIERIKSSLAREIFKQDREQIYQVQTKFRDDLREVGKETIADIIAQLNNGECDNQVIKELIISLSNDLKNHKGKKQYGYLKPEVKATVDRIVQELESDPRVATLYDLWYEQKYKILKTYTDTMPKKLPLVQNPEFKSIKNAIIREADGIQEEPENKDNTNLNNHNTNTHPTNTASSHRQGNAVSSNDTQSKAATGVIRLLAYLSKMFQNGFDKYYKGKPNQIDRKEKREIDKKKQAHGLKME